MSTSFIIATIGRETLRSTLRHIIHADNYSDILPEVVVVLDADNEVGESVFHDAQQEFSSHKNIKFLESRGDRGGARNKAIDASTGGVLVFLGDDIYIQKDYLARLNAWHKTHPGKNHALLGYTPWTKELMGDSFHQWLLDSVQFDYKNLNKGDVPDYRHFYTSNVSVKRELLGDERFSDAFTGWGFEDSELGRRLQKCGMTLHYERDLVAEHDHKQNYQSFISRTKESRINAQILEKLHPELRIAPRGVRKILLIIAIIVATILSPLSQKIRWWRDWKAAWLCG